MASSVSGVVGTVPDASTTTKGKIQIADAPDIAAGTDTTKAVTPAQLAASGASVPDATVAVKGKVLLATTTPTTGDIDVGTDTTKAVTPAGLQRKINLLPSLVAATPSEVGLTPAGNILTIALSAEIARAAQVATDISNAVATLPTLAGAAPVTVNTVLGVTTVGFNPAGGYNLTMDHLAIGSVPTDEAMAYRVVGSAFDSLTVGAFGAGALIGLGAGLAAPDAILAYGGAGSTVIRNAVGTGARVLTLATTLDTPATSDPTEAVFQYRRTTNAATPTVFVLGSIPVPDASIVMIEASVIGRSATGQCAYKRIGAWRRIGGNITILNAVSAPQTFETQVNYDCVMVQAVASDAIEIRVTSFDATLTTWHATVRYWEATT